MKISIKQILKNWWFPELVILIYGVTALVNFDIFKNSLLLGERILIKIIPIFLVIWVLMAVVNSLLGKKFFFRFLQEKGIKKWLVAVIGGLLSSGPIYLWYPLLADLKKKGFHNGLIACFLYNRAVKLPLLPLAIYYFGGKYIIILTSVMIVASLVQGIIIHKLLD
ncbi:hypothetical protein J7K70_00265 [bacterium]|nr:hypothetical protein [bacterium]